MKLFGNSRRRADRPRRSYRETESAAPREEMPSRTEPVQRAPRPTPQPSQRYAPQPRPVQPPETNPEPQQEGRLSGKTKGMLYVAAASLLLLGAIIMCIVLIAQQGAAAAAHGADGRDDRRQCRDARAERHRGDPHNDAGACAFDAGTRQPQ